MSNSPYPEINRTLSPPPAYHPRNTNNDGWDFFGENSNHRLSENIFLEAGPDYNNTAATSKDNLPNTKVNTSPYRFEGIDNNNHNNDQTPPDTRNKQSWLRCLLRVDSTRERRSYALDTRMGTCTLVFQAIYYIAAMIMLCVASTSIKLYKDPWNQSGVVGGATLAYCLAGLIVACVAGTLTICLTFLTYYKPLWAFLLQSVLMVMYALGGALAGYGSYITRNNQICNNKYTGEEFRDCYNIRLAAGWRCGIVVVAMCGVIILAQIVYSAKWVVSWLTDKKTTRSRRWGNRG